MLLFVLAFPWYYSIKFFFPVFVKKAVWFLVDACQKNVFSVFKICDCVLLQLSLALEFFCKALSIHSPFEAA